MLNIDSNASSVTESWQNSIDNPVISYCSQGKPYSYYNDDIWALLDRNSTVKFHMLEGGFKQAIKQIIYKLIVTNKVIVSERTYAGNWIEGAIACQKVIVAIGGDSYRYIESDKGYRRFISYAKTLKIKKKTWKNNLIILSKLYDMGFIDRKLESADMLAQELAHLSGETQQAMAIPEGIATAYIKASMEVVERYYPYRSNISKAYCDFVNAHSDFKEKYRCATTPSKKAKEVTSHNIPYEDFSLDLSGVWLSWLRGACYVLIASFTGCRDSEIKSFNLDSYTEETYGDIPISILVALEI